jgi:hypothetical protein
MLADLGEELRDRVDDRMIRDINRLGTKLWQMATMKHQLGRGRTEHHTASKMLGAQGAARHRSTAEERDEFDLTASVTQILAEEEEFFALRDSLDVSYITYRTKQVMDELNMLEQQRKEKLERD